MNYNFYTALNSFKDFNDSIIHVDKKEFLPVLKNPADGAKGLDLVPASDKNWIDSAERVVNFVSGEFDKIRIALKNPPCELRSYTLSRHQEALTFLNNFVKALQNNVSKEKIGWKCWASRLLKKMRCISIDTPATKMAAILQQQRQIQADLDQILMKKLQTEVADCEKIWIQHAEDLKKVNLETCQKIQTAKETFLQSHGTKDDLEKAITEIRTALKSVQGKILQIKEYINLALEDIKILEQCSYRPTFQKNLCIEALTQIMEEFRALDQSSLFFLEEGLAFCKHYFYSVYPDPEGSSRRTESRDASKLRGVVNAGQKEALRLNQLSSSSVSKDILQLLHVYLIVKDRQQEMNARKESIGNQFEKILMAKKIKVQPLVENIRLLESEMKQQRRVYSRLLPWNWFRPLIDEAKYRQTETKKTKNEKELTSLRKEISQLEYESATNQKVLTELEGPMAQINRTLSTFEQKDDVKKWIETIPATSRYNSVPHWLMGHFQPKKIEELAAARRLFEEEYLVTLESIHKSICSGALVNTSNEEESKKQLEEKAQQFKRYQAPADAKPVEERYPSKETSNLDSANKKASEQANSLFGKIVTLISAFEE